MADLLILLLVICGGIGAAAYGWRRFTAAAGRTEFQRQLDSAERGAPRSSLRDQAERAQVDRWADAELDRLRRERGGR